MRDFWLDPHTWVSSVPDAIAERLKGQRERVEICLTALGRKGWLQSLTDGHIRLPKFRGQQAFFAFLAEDMDADRIVLFAATFTRIRIALYLRDRVAVLAHTVRERNPVGELQDLALFATETLFHWQWAIPFDADGVFDFDLWEQSDIPY